MADNLTEFVTRIRADYAEALESKKYLHLKWRWHERLFEGDQWTDINTSAGVISPTHVSKNTTKLVINRIAPYVTKMTAKLLAQVPGMSVLPSRDETEDIDASEAAGYYLTYLDAEKIDYRSIQQENFQNLLLYGNGFLRPFFNHEKGKLKPILKVLTDENGEPKLAEDGTPYQTYVLGKDGRPQVRHTGEIDILAVNPFQVFVSTEATCWSEVTWLIEARMRTPEFVKRKYGIDVPPDKLDPYTSELPSEIASDLANKKGTKKGVTVLECWYLPTDRFNKLKNKPGLNIQKDGLFVTIIGDKAFNAIPLERLDKGPARLPHYFFGWEKRPRQFWFQGPIDRAAPLQQEMNRIRSDGADIRRRVVRPKVLLPKGCKTSPEAFTSKIGEIIEYVLTPMGGKPEFVNPPDMPMSYYEMYNAALRDFADVTFFHEQSQGKVASGTTSGVHAAALQEQDDTYLAPIVERINTNERRIAKDKLLLAKKFNIDDMMRIVDDDSGVTMRKFQAIDLADGFDVRFVVDSLAPMTKSQRFETIMTLISTGLIDPDTQKEAVLKILQVGLAPTKLYTEQRKHELWAERENLTMSQGTYVEPNPLFDNHLIHIEQHMIYANSGEFKKLAPEIQVFISAHVQRHMEAAMPPAAPVTDQAASFAAANDSRNESQSQRPQA